MAVRIRPKDPGARKPHRPSQVPPEAQAPRMFQETHAGMSGKNNEDAVETGVVPGPNGRPRYVAIVADGIGGHASGEVASHMALRHVMDFLNQHPMAPLPQALVQAVTRANQAVFTESQKKDLWKGMGTTLTIAVVEDGCLYLAHVGDSRAYLIRGERIVQLTVDHTWAQEAIEAGRLTPEEARTHPNRNVLKRYVGIQPEVEVDLRITPPNGDGPPDPRHQPLALQPGDVVLLCTDGLHDLISDERILEIVRTLPGDQAVKALVAAANAAGGPDNISVAMIELPGRKIARPPLRLSLPPLTLPMAAGALVLGLGLILAWAWLFRGGSGEEDAGGFRRSRSGTPIVIQGGGATSHAPVIGPSREPTSTPVPTPTPSPTPTPRPSPTFTRTPTPTSTFTPTPSPMPSGGGGGGGGGGGEGNPAPPP